MMNLIDIAEGVYLKGLDYKEIVLVEKIIKHTNSAFEIIYKKNDNSIHSEILYNTFENSLEIIAKENLYNSNNNSLTFKLILEAYRLKHAFTFDPYLAINDSKIEPFPHQIEAVYNILLNKQPLRYLLADDPGSGKTIMSGLLIKELIFRSNLKRCLIVTPGIIMDQWQSELYEKFGIPFEILTNEKLNTTFSSNWFLSNNLVIASLDKLSRDDSLHSNISSSSWDLIIIDEAHKMTASYLKNNIKETKRYKLGKLLSNTSRNLLLLTATPHNGKSDEFNLFLNLLDRNRFIGKHRTGVHTFKITDMFRRKVKEQLVDMDGNPLLPKRYSYSIKFKLSESEHNLYNKVTQYVKEQFLKLDNLNKNVNKNAIGFALTILQRRLASSSEAIHQSLVNRYNKLNSIINDFKRNKSPKFDLNKFNEPYIEINFNDVYEYNEENFESLEDKISILYTASENINELEKEVSCLNELIEASNRLKEFDYDSKWVELSKLINEHLNIDNRTSLSPKLIIFSEHKAK